MRLMHYGPAGGAPRVAVAIGGGPFVDLAAVWARRKDAGAAPASIDEVLRRGLLPEIARLAAAAAPDAGAIVDPAKVRISVPVLEPPKIIGVGANYQDHVAEFNGTLPAEPVFFAKWRNSLVGPGEPVRLPAASVEVDYEAELVVVIGKRGKDISEADAMSHVAGYTVGNDLSARDWQLRKPLRQWTVGKAFDTFLPLGPYLVTADEVADPYSLRLRCEISGEVLQDAPTAMHFKIPTLVAYLSQALTLEPGDLFLTGTPAGVGMVKTPPRFLRAGDTLVSSIEGIGRLENPVV